MSKATKLYILGGVISAVGFEARSWWKGEETRPPLAKVITGAIVVPFWPPLVFDAFFGERYPFVRDALAKTRDQIVEATEKLKEETKRMKEE